MIIIAVVIIIGIIIGLLYESYQTSILQKIGYGILGAFIGLLLGGVLMMMVSLMVPDGSTEEYVHHTTKLVAFADNMNTTGSFFLGCGTVEEEMRFHFYYKGKLGAEYGWINTNNTYIIEESTGKPRIETYYKRLNEGSSWIWWTTINKKTKRIIYVPEGSIKQNYNLDLK